MASRLVVRYCQSYGVVVWNTLPFVAYRAYHCQGQSHTNKNSAQYTYKFYLCIFSFFTFLYLVHFVFNCRKVGASSCSSGTLCLPVPLCTRAYLGNEMVTINLSLKSNRKPGLLIQKLPSDSRLEVRFSHFGRFSMSGVHRDASIACSTDKFYLAKLPNVLDYDAAFLGQQHAAVWRLFSRSKLWGLTGQLPHCPVWDHTC